MITVRFPTNPPVEFKMPASVVDGFIIKLEKLRSYMKPEVPGDYTEPFNAIVEPKWAVAREALEEHSALHLRHPGLGWLHFMLPPSEAKRLGEQLIVHSENLGREPSHKN
jgi:hypothetical protein